MRIMGRENVKVELFHPQEKRLPWGWRMPGPLRIWGPRKAAKRHSAERRRPTFPSFLFPLPNKKKENGEEKGNFAPFGIASGAVLLSRAASVCQKTRPGGGFSLAWAEKPAAAFGGPAGQAPKLHFPILFLFRICHRLARIIFFSSFFPTFF